MIAIIYWLTGICLGITITGICYKYHQIRRNHMEDDFTEILEEEYDEENVVL